MSVSNTLISSEMSRAALMLSGGAFMLTQTTILIFELPVARPGYSRLQETMYNQ